MTVTQAGLKVNFVLVVAICFLVSALEGYDIQAFGVAAPHFAPLLGLNASQVGVAGSAAMAGLVLGAIFGGWIADRVGRKPVLLVSIAAFGLFSIATSLAQDYQFMVLARFATGVGIGGAMPNIIAIAAEISTAKTRATTVTTMFCGMPAGGAVVALISSYAEHLDWRGLFVIGGLLPLLILPIVYFLLPETRPDHAPEVDRRALPALFGGGRAAVTLLLWLTFIFTLIILYLLLNWLPTLVVAKGFTQADGAMTSMVFNIVSVGGAVGMGYLADRVGFRGLLTTGYLLLAAALWALAEASDLSLIMIFSGLTGLLVIGGQYTLYALAPAYYPPQVRAAGSGAAVAMGRLGSIVGPLLAGQLRQAGATAGEVLLSLVPLAVGGAIGAFILTSRGKPADGTQGSRIG